MNKKCIHYLLKYLRNNEYVVNESSSEKENSESQKGPVASGRVLADIIKSSSKATEKKFLHDYSYSIFEKYLIDENLVLSVTSPTLELQTLQTSINNYSFIKLKQELFSMMLKK